MYPTLHVHLSIVHCIRVDRYPYTDVIVRKWYEMCPSVKSPRPFIEQHIHIDIKKTLTGWVHAIAQQAKEGRKPKMDLDPPKMNGRHRCKQTCQT